MGERRTQDRPPVIKPKQVRTPWDAYAFASALIAIGAVLAYNDYGHIGQGFDEETGLLGFALGLVIMAFVFAGAGVMMLMRKLSGVPTAMAASAFTMLIIASWYLYEFLGGASTVEPGCFHASVALVSLWLLAYAYFRTDYWVRCGGWETRTRKLIPDDKVGPPCQRCGRTTSIDWKTCAYCGKILEDEETGGPSESKKS